MTISTNNPFPKVAIKVVNKDEISDANSGDLFGKGTSVLFGVPGAFTPTCSAAHLPGYVVHADAIKAKGVDRIVCMSVNDAFVMKAWGASAHAEELTMLADGNAELTAALGLEMDGTGFGMGKRCKRFAMIIKDGVVQDLFVEAPGKFEVSAAEYVMEKL